MGKAQQKPKIESQIESKTAPKEPTKIIPFKNGKRLKKADDYPPGIIFLREPDYSLSQISEVQSMNDERCPKGYSFA